MGGSEMKKIEVTVDGRAEESQCDEDISPANVQEHEEFFRPNLTQNETEKIQIIEDLDFGLDESERELDVIEEEKEEGWGEELDLDLDLKEVISEEPPKTESPVSTTEKIEEQVEKVKLLDVPES